jgi:hypothetical protein
MHATTKDASKEAKQLVDMLAQWDAVEQTPVQPENPLGTLQIQVYDIARCL